MTRNQLPEGVGKKIVEALKRQAEADITPVNTQQANAIGNDIYFNDVQDISDADFDSLSSSQEIGENLIVEDNNANVINNNEQFEIKSDLEQKTEEHYVAEEQPLNTQNQTDLENDFAQLLNEQNNEKVFEVQNIQENTFTTPSTEPQMFNMNNTKQQNTYNQPSVQNVQTFNTNIPLSEETQKVSTISTVLVKIPTNVAVLRNLIASLPVGVTKQTGAQIIRQTLEAMGLPMASVLKEAQEVQEELNTNTRECMLKIQEYKTNIMQLEQSVQEYQKHVNQINDLVSLFLLTDRK